MTALERTPEEEKRLLDKQRDRSERASLRRQERADEFKGLVDKVKTTAARQVALKRYVFLPDEDLLTKHKLTPQQIAIVRQWEQPKRNAAFTVESSSKLIEAETRAQGETKKGGINVENLTIIKLPEKGVSSLPPPVYVDVDVEVAKK